MDVFIEKENKHLKLDKSCTGEELLAELGINPSTVILVCNDEAILTEETLSETDTVKILTVVSGG